MKLFNPSIYNNLLEIISTSSENITDYIVHYPLEFYSARNENVEWKMSFPMFIHAFYDCIIIKNKIPTQQEYWEYYLKYNTDFFAINKFSSEIIAALKARVYRAYPSLVRDIHFSTFVREQFASYKIMYNTVLDIQEGIDLLIIAEENYFALNLYTNTSRAIQGREKKVHRHIPFDNVKYLEIPVAFKGSVKCGRFFLYGQREIEIIKTQLKHI